MVLLRETNSSVWRETSYYVMTTKRAGQVRGELNPWPPWAAECAGDHWAVDELVSTRTVHLVTFGVTCWTADGRVFNSISTDQLTCGGRKPQYWCYFSRSYRTGAWSMKIHKHMVTHSAFISRKRSPNKKIYNNAMFINVLHPWSIWDTSSSHVLLSWWSLFSCHRERRIIGK